MCKSTIDGKVLRRGISYLIKEFILASWMTLTFVTYVTERSRRFEGDWWKAREEAHAKEEGEAKGHPCTLDGVSALNVEGRGPFNGRAVFFLSFFPLLLFTSPFLRAPAR